jgi:tRNA dimethylallyltransferase
MAASNPSPAAATIETPAPAFYVLGPTAVGKSEVAVEIALRCEGEVIGADAFQVYRGLDLLTAKPSAELLARVPHHLIGDIALASSFDVARYAALAHERIRQLRERGKRAVVCGGTGLYARALTHGLNELPHADATLRQELEALSLEELQKRIREHDPAGAAQIDLRNPRRLIRALEVCLLTGRPFSSFRDRWQSAPPVAGVILLRNREELHERIAARTLAMFENGVVEEVAACGEIGSTASQAIGWREIRALLEGKLTREECIDSIAQATRQYARRQLTWFRRETAFEVVNLSATPADEALLQRLAARAGSLLPRPA